MADDARLASVYLACVKETLHNEPAKFTEFIQVMKDFRASRITTFDVCTRVSQILKYHPKLLLGFTVFLPKDQGTGEGESHELTLDDALRYMAYVEEEYRDKPAQYQEFLKILFTPHIDIAKVEELLKDKCELLSLLGVFLLAEFTRPSPPP